MLKSKTVFIQKGSLSAVDNGKKKFNSSEIRYIDEQLLKSPDKYGDFLPMGMDKKSEMLLRSELLSKITIINRELETIEADEKVLIYGGGQLAQFLLRHTNIDSLNIIGIVDRNRVPVFDIEIQDTSLENIEKADVIIITPYYASGQIKDYLNKLHFSGKVICLADICGEVILTGHKNIWAPDSICDEYKCNNINAINMNEFVDTIDTVNKNSPYFVSVKEHVPYGRLGKETPKYKQFEEKVAIVIQGPLVYQQDFTYESIKLYYSNFPKVKIILSVWEGEEVLECYPDIERYNVSVVFSVKPVIKGYQNINLQLTTSEAGIRKAKELGCEFAFKTRTDMRFYSPYMVPLMYWYMKKFPICGKGEQRQRLVIFPPRYEYFYYINDFFMFGNVDDMLLYWGTEPNFSDKHMGESVEVMLGIRYAKHINCEIENDLSNLDKYCRMLSDRFAVVDDKLLDYVWYKYFYNKLWEHEYHHNTFLFSDWLAEQKLKKLHVSNSVNVSEDFQNSGIKRKKVLFYVTDARMATLYLQTVDLTNVFLRLVRNLMKSGDTCLYSNRLILSNRSVEVEIIKDEDYEWADEIWFLSRDSISVEAQRFVSEKWKNKLKIIENPYIGVEKIYENSAKDKYEIWNSFYETENTTYVIEGTDLPYIFEPRMSHLNKIQKDVYATYSIGRKDLLAGIYFDELAISMQKGYEAYHGNVKVILWSNNRKNTTEDFEKNLRQFVDESVLYYKSLYGENSVLVFEKEVMLNSDALSELVTMSNLRNEQETLYLVIPDTIRILSPYIVQLFESLKVMYGTEKMGIVNPSADNDGELPIVYGTGEQLKRLGVLLQGDDRYQKIMDEFVVLDYEMLHVIDLNRSFYSTKDKEKQICFADWALNIM